MDAMFCKINGLILWSIYGRHDCATVNNLSFSFNNTIFRVDPQPLLCLNSAQNYFWPYIQLVTGIVNSIILSKILFLRACLNRRPLNNSQLWDEDNRKCFRVYRTLISDTVKQGSIFFFWNPNQKLLSNLFRLRRK